MADLRISDLVTASQLKNDDYYEISQSESGTRVSYKATLLAIAVQIATMVDFTSDLNTTSKKITGAINELKQLISLIPQFSIEVVEELPTEDISDTTIYLVPAEDPEVGNYYEEYIHVNDAWELVGTTAVDLSAYYTKLEVDGLLATKASVTEVALKENKSDMPTDVRTIIKDCKTPKSATITNGIAQFECIEENLVKGLKVTMNPIQDLHGYEYPWVGGAGKNKYPILVGNDTGINNNASGTHSTGTNGELIVTTSTGLASGCYFLSSSTLRTLLSSMVPCYVSFDVVCSASATVRIGNETSSSSLINVSTTKQRVTQEFTSASSFVIYGNGNAVTITISNLMVSATSETQYYPYSNICPISGRTEVSVVRTPFDISPLYNGMIQENGTYTSNNARITNANKTQSNVYFLKKGTHTLSFKKLNGNAVNLVECSVLTKNASFVTVDNFASSWHSLPYTFTTTEDAYLYFTARKDYSTALDPSNYKALIDAETHTHQYSETIYGGVDDFVNGGATSDMAIVDLGSLSWSYNEGTPNRFKATISNIKLGGKGICSSYPRTQTRNVDKAFYMSDSYYGSNAVIFYNSDYTSASDFKASVNGQTLCYELATPTTISTSAEEITTVSGTNIISGTEPISECKYTELATVDDLIKIIGGQ